MTRWAEFVAVDVTEADRRLERISSEDRRWMRMCVELALPHLPVRVGEG